MIKLKPKKTLYLLDISSLFFRSYYAISLNMKNEKGIPTNALYGVLKMIQQLTRKKSPDYLICCFDTKAPSFRKELYPEYKANRDEMPEDLVVQVPYLKTMMEKLLISSWEKPGFEADDLIASAVCSGKDLNLETYIVSGDKDFAQIVDNQTFLYDTMKDQIYNPEEVELKWGVPPSQMQDYLSIVGDASDNIPGVRGIGPKGAVQLLKSYSSLEQIYQNIEQLKESSKEKLLKSKDQAFLSKKLIALREDLLWEKKISEASYQPISEFSESDKEDLKIFLEELSFKSFIKNLFPKKTESAKPLRLSLDETISSYEKHQLGTGITPEQKKLNKMSPVSLKNSLKIKPISLEEFKKTLPPYPLVWIGQFQESIYLAHGKTFTTLSPKELKELTSFFDQKWIRYFGHDLKSLWKIFQPKNPVPMWDSMIAAHLLDSKPSVSLRLLFELYLKIPREEELSLAQFVYQEQTLQRLLLEELQKQNLESLFNDIELPLVGVLYDMERQGILIDLKEIEKQSQSLGEDIQNLEHQIHKLANEDFNISSPKQLAVILFEKLKLPRGRKTKTGYSTDSNELMKLKQLHPILPLLLEYREFFKLKSTYTDSLIALRDKDTGRIHTNFKQTGATTGRLSSVNPNLQNIPIRTERGRMVRKAFIVPESYQMICSDYSQIELRILAHITEDKNLCKAFEEGLDIHASTASDIFNIPLHEVSPELRRKSKAVNFGIAYGQGVYGLAESLSISRTEAKEIIENYFKKFKKVKEYMETVKQELPQKNYVETLYGRKRFFNPEDLKHPRLRSAIERAAINAPLQGTASDLVKKAMITLNESLPIPLLSQIHDELLFECPKDKVEFESKQITSIMEDNDILRVPLKVNLSSGQNWDEAHS